MAVTLDKSNPYTTGYVLNLNDGRRQLERERLAWKGGREDQYHTVVDGDRLDLIAWTYWRAHVPNAHRYWWVLADANDVENPLDISGLVGLEIVVPNIYKVLLRV